MLYADSAVFGIYAGEIAEYYRLFYGYDMSETERKTGSGCRNYSPPRCAAHFFAICRAPKILQAAAGSAKSHLTVIPEVRAGSVFNTL
jgi:hypothetical protein